MTGVQTCALPICGFYYGQITILKKDSDDAASNAHNLYLTLLSEGGFLFIAGYISLIAIAGHCVIKTKNFDALLSLIILMIYWGFSGEFYESSRYTTAGPYFFFIFLLAYIRYMEMKNVRTYKKYIPV